MIPGGFAFGDRYYKNATSEYVISPGQMAIESPVTSIIKEAYENKIPILGICNGFQILTKLNLLPGELKLNNDKKFTCRNVQCILTKNNEKNILSLQIANSFGNYFIEEEKLQELKANNQIILTYNDKTYDNGSIEGIAGVCDKNHLVFGMMPHPERTKDETIKKMLHNIVQLKDSSDSQQIFHEKAII